MSLIADGIRLARKDVLIEFRARQAMASAVALAGIALILVGLAVGPQPDRLRALAPALVWIALLYAAVSVAERLEQIDRTDDAFTGLWLVVADRRSLFVGRVLSLSSVLTLLQLALWVAAIFLLDLPVRIETILIVPLALLTSLAASSAAALILVLVAGVNHRPLLLPVALLPVLVPTFLAGVMASSALFEARASDAVGWVATLAIEAAFFVGLGLLAYETAASPE